MYFSARQLYHFHLFLSLGFFLPYPIGGMSPPARGDRPFPPVPTLSIPGIQSGSDQPPTLTPPSPPLSTRPLIMCCSSRSRFPSARFLARMYPSWSSRNIRPSPGPVFADPALGAGIEYFVPLTLYWKFVFRWTCIAGASGDASGDATVTDARISVGLPQDGQNCFELSLQILDLMYESSTDECDPVLT